MDFAHSAASTHVEAVGRSNGTQGGPKVCPKSLQLGNTYVLYVDIPIDDFNNACCWLESHTLIGYFLNRIPMESVIHS